MEQSVVTVNMNMFAVTQFQPKLGIISTHLKLLKMQWLNMMFMITAESIDLKECKAAKFMIGKY